MRRDAWITFLSISPNSLGVVRSRCGESATFGYDTVGNLVDANNDDARVHRVYNRAGSLESETQTISTYDTLDVAR